MFCGFYGIMAVMPLWLGILLAVVGLVVGGFACYLFEKYVNSKKISHARTQAVVIVEEANLEAKTIKKEAILEAKEEILKLRTDFEKESKERRSDLTRQETRLLQKEESIDKKDNNLTKKQEQLEQQQKQIQNKEDELGKRIGDIDKREEMISKELERVAGLTAEQAKEQLVETIVSGARRDAANIVKAIETEAKENGDKKAREIISQAIQRCAADQVSEATITTIPLPSDDIKGRLIGREGRNIRALENATGVDLIIDDTPEVVILSGFDPVRRQIARITVEKLIADGRIHPARIEEMAEKVKKEMDVTIKEAGEAATLDVGVFGLHPEIVKLLGRLKFRTSYGQNVLNHSIEVSYIAGVMATELGVDVALAKRAGLLHDIGKAIDCEVEGTHIQIGADIAKKYRESKDVVNAIMAHHGDVEARTVEAVLVAAADAVSGARPGARRETIENYVKRLEKLEEIANSFEGIQKTYALQAGREIRIMVKPEVVNDPSMVVLAKDIAKRIETEMEYPGQIKVNVIRETRAFEYAK
ncbi:MAG: ribonuclease Y [Clostridia bacterium]|nr:ribonuclease Y [Clostridia bacterium]